MKALLYSGFEFGLCKHGDELSSSSSGIAYDTENPFFLVEEFRGFFNSTTSIISELKTISF
jgi:hypothetical protein